MRSSILLGKGGASRDGLAASRRHGGLVSGPNTRILQSQPKRARSHPPHRRCPVRKTLRSPLPPSPPIQTGVLKFPFVIELGSVGSKWVSYILGVPQHASLSSSVADISSPTSSVPIFSLDTAHAIDHTT